MKNIKIGVILIYLYIHIIYVYIAPIQFTVWIIIFSFFTSLKKFRYFHRHMQLCCDGVQFLRSLHVYYYFFHFFCLFFFFFCSRINHAPNHVGGRKPFVCHNWIWLIYIDNERKVVFTKTTTTNRSLVKLFS